MKRFYKETAVDAGDGGWRVLLDGKPMRTPAKAMLVTPTRALADAIAREWSAVPDKAEIVSLDFAGREQRVVFTGDASPKFNAPVVVLVNGGSASAAVPFAKCWRS